MFQEQTIEKKSVGEFASDSAQLIRKVHSTKQPLLVTDDGEDTAIVLDSEEYAQMAERLQMFEDVAAAQQEFREGKGIDFEIASKQLLAHYGG
jgi:prevent-host-death family protein